MRVSPKKKKIAHLHTNTVSPDYSVNSVSCLFVFSIRAVYLSHLQLYLDPVSESLGQRRLYSEKV